MQRLCPGTRKCLENRIEASVCQPDKRGHKSAIFCFVGFDVQVWGTSVSISGEMWIEGRKEDFKLFFKKGVSFL